MVSEPTGGGAASRGSPRLMNACRIAKSSDGPTATRLLGWWRKLGWQVDHRAPTEPWLVPTPESSVGPHLTREGSTWEVPQKTSDPARALANLLARNQFFTSEFAREAAALPACEPPLPISAGRVYSDMCESCHCNGDAMWRSGLSRYRTSTTRHANLLTACCGERPIRRGL